MNRPFWHGMAVAGVVSMTASLAVAQAPQIQVVRGTVEKIDGPTLVVKARNGSDVTIKLADNWTATALVKASLSDVKQGSFVGAAAMPQPDGTQKAIEVHIFPEWLKASQGHTPFDLQPNSTMTNAIVDQTVTSVDGQVLTVKYPGGEKKIIVSPNTPVVAFDKGDRAEVKDGSKVIVRAAKQSDGSLTAASVTYGRDGLTPPM